MRQLKRRQQEFNNLLREQSERSNIELKELEKTQLDRKLNEIINLEYAQLDRQIKEHEFLTLRQVDRDRIERQRILNTQKPIIHSDFELIDSVETKLRELSSNLARSTKSDKQ